MRWSTCSKDEQHWKKFSASCRSSRLPRLIALPASGNFLSPSLFVLTVERNELSRKPPSLRKPPSSWESRTNEIHQSSIEVGQGKAQPAYSHCERTLRALPAPARSGRHPPSRREDSRNVLQHRHAVSRGHCAESPLSPGAYWSGSAHSLRSPLLPAGCGRWRGIYRHFAASRPQNRARSTIVQTSASAQKSRQARVAVPPSKICPQWFFT